MKDTIYRQDAIDTFLTIGNICVYGEGVCKAVVSRIEQLPSAEPEIIHCRDCKYYDGRPCGIVDYYNTESDFCSRAERRTDEAD